MNITLCTLFEGDYHFGVAALLNSLHHAGFAGTFICGYRGPLPPWAGETARLTPIRVVWTERKPAVHFTHHKPDFMLACLEHAATADVIAYFDPDIVLKAEWPVFARWVGAGGVSLCEDLNAYLPSGHPYRLAWQEFFARHDLMPIRQLERYYNAGFIAVPRILGSFLRQWSELVALGVAETGCAGAIKHGEPNALFHTLDQDALNMALQLHPAPIYSTGAEGMDFQPGGHLLSHAAGVHKPWRRGFLRAALAGRPPNGPSKQFHRYAADPLPLFSPCQLALRRGELAAAAFLGRFYRRA